jgi:hypothetical protein
VSGEGVREGSVTPSPVEADLCRTCGHRHDEHDAAGGCFAVGEISAGDWCCCFVFVESASLASGLAPLSFGSSDGRETKE